MEQMWKKHFWTSISAQHFFRSGSQPVAALQLVSFCVNQCKCRYGILVTFKEDCPKKQIVTREQTGTGHHVSRAVKTWQDAGLKTGPHWSNGNLRPNTFRRGQWPPHHLLSLGVFVQVTKTTFELGRHSKTTIWLLNTQLPVWGRLRVVDKKKIIIMTSHISNTRGSRAAALQSMLVGSRSVSNAESISKKGALQDVNTKRFSCCQCGHISRPSSLSSLKTGSLKYIKRYCSLMDSRMRKKKKN